ncbi:MAG: hypothetical protein AAGF74_10730 [Pseudomonadota bacterium]
MGLHVYADDTFFHLTNFGRAGLAALSLAMGFGLLRVQRAAGRHLHIALRILLALGLFYDFIWLSPQVYYTYFRLIMDGLPAQVVVGPPPNPLEVLQLMTFTAKHSIAVHTQGLLGWAMFAAAVLPKRRRVRGLAA